MATFGGQLGVGTSIETSEITDDSITNAKIKSDAAIAYSKMESDARARANHTGTQTKSTVSDYPAAASQAEMEAGTETAAREMTPQRVKQAIDALAASVPTCVSLIPMPVIPVGSAATTNGIVRTTEAGTTMSLALVFIPFKITANKITIRTGTVTVNCTLDISLYSQDGATRVFSITTATIVATTDNNKLITTALSAVVINAGYYYIAVNEDTNGDMEYYVWDSDAAVPFSGTMGIAEDIASEPVYEGVLTITGSTPPTTIDPTAISTAADRALIFRLDN